MYLLDTDIIIYSLKGDRQTVDNFRLHAKDPKAVSVITYGELVFGAQRSRQTTRNLAKVHHLREIFPVIDITCSIMDTFGALKAEMYDQGTVVDDFDLLIASTAISLDYRIVTNNEKHFSKIPGIELENWSK